MPEEVVSQYGATAPLHDSGAEEGEKHEKGFHLLPQSGLIGPVRIIPQRYNPDTAKTDGRVRHVAETAESGGGPRPVLSSRRRTLPPVAGEPPWSYSGQ